MIKYFQYNTINYGFLIVINLQYCQLFDFDIEVKPILEVLVGKTVEQALLEVMEEEELANLRTQQVRNQRYCFLKTKSRSYTNCFFIDGSVNLKNFGMPNQLKLRDQRNRNAVIERKSRGESNNREMYWRKNKKPLKNLLQEHLLR